MLLAWRCVDDAELVLAANRDELLDRAAAPPGALHTSPRIIGGRDLVAGGTWLAVRADGAVAAVTNRRTGARNEVFRDPGRRSRGELPLALLTAADPADALARLDAHSYNPFNVLLCTRDGAFVAHGDDAGLRVLPLDHGIHVLCVHDVDGPEPKERRLRTTLRERLDGNRSGRQTLEVMTALLADHETAGGDWLDAACIHGERYGTVSATSLLVRRDGSLTYRFAEGRPCVTPYTDVAVGAAAEASRTMET